MRQRSGNAGIDIGKEQVMRLFDLHCDTLYECYMGDSYLEKNQLQVDLERGLQYDAWAQVFAVWMPDSIRGEAAYDQCCAILRFADDQAALYRDRMKIVRNADELDQTAAEHRCAAILAVEGGSAFAGRLQHINDLARQGVKIVTLTWNGSNELGHGSLSGCEEGLTAFGKAAVRRMEKYGMIPDVSHLNERGFWDVADILHTPFIASHSVSAAVCGHPRNLTDAQFAAIRDCGGLVGLDICAEHLGTQTFACLERHLYHYLSLEGEHTVAFGCDFDGTALPAKWGGIQMMSELYEYFLRNRYDESCLDRLFFGNCSDFFAATLTRGGEMY